MSSSADRLISGLVDDLKPVQALPRLRSAFALVLSVWVAVLAVVLWFPESPTGASSLLAGPVFLATFVGLLFTALGGTLSALAAGRPGRDRIETRGLVVSLAGWIAAAGACLIGMDGLDIAAHASPVGADVMCFRRGVLLSIFPAGVILAFLVWGWTSHPIRAALVAAGAAGALGASIVHLSCDYPDPGHLLMGHLSIPVAIGWVGLYPLGLLLRRLRN